MIIYSITVIYFREAETKPKAFQIFDNFLHNHNFYCFSSKDICIQLDKILMKKGMNCNERQDFITFWLPELISKSNVIISFLPFEIYDSFANLKISPKPSKIIRIFMLFKPVDFQSNSQNFRDYIIEENIERENYNNTLVVEWGAMNLEYIS